MTLIKVTFVTAGLLLASFLSLFAQEQGKLKIGARVRVTASPTTIRPSRYIGTVMAVNADTLVLKTYDQSVSLLMLPLASMTRIQVSRGRVSRGVNVLKGMGIGLLSGAVFGAIVGYATGVNGDYEDDSDCAGICPETREDVAVISAVLFSGPGLIVGGLMGLLWDNERWKEVPLERVRIGIAPYSHGGFLFSALLTI